MSITPVNFIRYSLATAFGLQILLRSVPLFIHGVMRQSVIFHSQEMMDLSFLQLQTEIILFSSVFFAFHFGFYLSAYDKLIRTTVIIGVAAIYYFLIAQNLSFNFESGSTGVISTAVGQSWIYDFVIFIFSVISICIFSILTQKYASK